MMVNKGNYNKSKEQYVHEIFTAIAHRYDLLNSILSLNSDKGWRRFAAAELNLKPGGNGLDVCCGTGMLAIEQARIVGPDGKVTALDFCENMLARAESNISETEFSDVITLVEGNAVDLPFPERSFDCASIGFALRNVPSIEKTIREMKRVVKKGGRVVSLELSKPSAPLFKQLYYFYFNNLVPAIGRFWSGVGGPYSYLPNSLKDFPHQEKIRQLFEDVGLENAHYHELTGGIVSVHVGTV